MIEMRTETDRLGKKDIPKNALYGIQTARALDNFALDHKSVNIHLIHGIVQVKMAAALTYAELSENESEKFRSIAYACKEVLSGKYNDQFPAEAYQGGAGTTMNMNVNEVLANLALLRSGSHPGEYDKIHPLDDVNRGQSTNDVVPTGLRIAAIKQLRRLSGECAKLQTSLQEKENEFQDIPKLGRTEWMDAVPVTLGQEFGAYAQGIARDRWRLYKVEERLRQVNLGGTAVGGGDNADRRYRFMVIEKLRELTGLGLALAEYPMDLTQNLDVYVEVSGLLKALAVNLMKIANDFRIMNSGPYGGLGEIHLAKLQYGSTIMPGKVNPVIPEMVMQCAIKVMANDSAISMAASHGEFELNACTPLVADCLLESLELMSNTVKLFRKKAVETVTADKEKCREHLDNSYAFATEYVRKLGYDKVSEIIGTYPPRESKRILDDLCSGQYGSHP